MIGLDDVLLIVLVGIGWELSSIHSPFLGGIRYDGEDFFWDNGFISKRLKVMEE